MKPERIPVLLASLFSLNLAWITLPDLGPFNPTWLPYGAFVTKSSGNPNWDNYAGQAGSTYDSAANPPQTIGAVQYNPYAPLPSVTPAASSGTGATPPMR
jgi:hypothetical protein